MEKIGAGIIGLGVGRHHCEGYANAEHVDFLAVCDLIPERRSWAQEKYGVKAYDDLDAFLARDDVEVVSVCTPDHTHIDVAKKVMAAGKHMLLEKPITITLPDALEIAELARQTDKLVGIGYEFRLCPVVTEIKRAIDDGTLGEVAGVSMYDWRGPFGRNKWGKWIQSASKSGGMIVEEVCHWFDLLRLFGGEIEEVHCVWNDWVHKDFDFEDIAYINCIYESGAAGHITHSLAGFDHLFDIWAFGTKASSRGIQKERLKGPFDVGQDEWYGLVATRDHWTSENFDEGGNLRPDGEEACPIQRKTFGIEATEPACIAAEADVFAKSVLTGEPFITTVDDGVQSLVAALAARRSAKERRPVRCAEILDEATS